MHIGIDLGTTNTVVSYAKRKARGGVEPQVMRITQLDEYNSSIQEEILPSGAFFWTLTGILCNRQKRQNTMKRVPSGQNPYQTASGTWAHPWFFTH